jgi:phosphoribosylanthranilate isomerase
MLRVKICGLMRQKDVRTALESGADAVGFVVASPSSPRNLSLERARRMMRAVPIFATKVIVTSANDPRTIRKICSASQPDALQLHHYNLGMIRKLRSTEPEMKLILATAVKDQSSLADAKRSSDYSNAVLADTPSASGTGGTGRVHDWKLTAKLRQTISPHPLIMAGGLTPKNVQLAIRMVRPFAVDVSSGVEREIGAKDPAKVHEFIMNAKELTT